MKLRVVSYILFLFILAETLLRLAFYLLMGTPFIKPGDIIYRYYPMVKEIRLKYAQTDPAKFKILILSCSTLQKEWGNFETILGNKLNEPDTLGLSGSAQSFAIFNAAGIGFASLDNLNCYRLLSDLKFELVVDYAGINDARFNNCPKDVFKEDYGHIAWNNEINCILRHPKMNFLISPFFIDFLYQLAKEYCCRNCFIPNHYSLRPFWWSYGSDLKSIKAFKENTGTIQDICKKKNEDLLLVPYCYYMPSNYTLERFKTRQLDYSFRRNSREIEIWGSPVNVSAFLDSSNSVVKDMAIANGIHYLDIRPAMLQNSAYFADVCHFSEQGLSVFSGLLSQEIKKGRNTP